MSRSVTYAEAVEPIWPVTGYEGAWRLLEEGRGALEVSRLTGVPLEEVDQLAAVQRLAKPLSVEVPA